MDTKGLVKALGEESLLRHVSCTFISHLRKSISLGVFRSLVIAQQESTCLTQITPVFCGWQLKVGLVIFGTAQLFCLPAETEVKLL